MTGTRIHNIWKGMLSRCQNPNRQSFRDYGAKGVAICDRWRVFENFYEDMAGTYIDGLTIDRIDVNKGYEPGNCRWLHRSEQSANRRPGKEWNLKESPISTNKSGIRGVSWDKSRGKWHAAICVNGKQKNLGNFETKEQARDAYLAARQTMR
jgi:hypothetical protein